MLVDIIAHPHWFWLTLGGLLLAAEMLGTSGYLLWSGQAAVIVGLIEWFVPVSWTAQGSLFAVLTLVCVFLWYRWMRHREARQKPNALNQRGSQMIGLQLTLDTALQKIGEANNSKVVMMPLEASSLLGSIAGIGELLKESRTESKR